MKKDKARPGFDLKKLRFRFTQSHAIGLAGAVAVTALLVLLLNHVKRFECFRISSVLVRDGQQFDARLQEDFSYLKGVNIFDLDVKRQARLIAAQNPQYKLVRFTKLLPDQIIVDFVRRTPVARIDTAVPMFVDEQCVVFKPDPGAVQPQLPVITGLSRKLPALFSGWRCSQPELLLAMEIVVKARKSLGAYTVERVDVVQPANASLFISVRPVMPVQTRAPATLRNIASGGLLEVRIGQEDIAARMQTLATVLAQVRQNIYTISYIDLRFQEPVIKFQERTKGAL